MLCVDQNPNGLQKSEETNGRSDIALSEIHLFEKNLVLGVGVGKGKEIRTQPSGETILSHSEITRTLAEQGMLGMITLFILIITPIILFIKNKKNFYQNKKNVYMVCFFAFWILTINHSAMRVAAPSFIYSLALLTQKKDDDINSV